MHTHMAIPHIQTHTPTHAHTCIPVDAVSMACGECNARADSRDASTRGLLRCSISRSYCTGVCTQPHVRFTHIHIHTHIHTQPRTHTHTYTTTYTHTHTRASANIHKFDTHALHTQVKYHCTTCKHRQTVWA